MSAWVGDVGGRALALGLVTAILLGGCGALPEGRGPGTATPSGTPTVVDPPPEPSPPAPPTSADDVRRSGRAVTVGDVTVHVLAGSGSGAEDTTDDDGAVILALPPSPGQGSPAQSSPAPDVPVLLLAGPADTGVEVLVDGTAVLRDAEGAVVVGVVAEVGRLRGGEGGLVAVLPRTRTAGADGATDGARVVVGRSALVSADWADRGDEGGLSLVVVPRPWVRTAGAAGVEAVWSALGLRGELGADATAPGMRDQLECHAVGAPDKESWNLEPWRPDVGLLATLAARCNPA